MSLDFGGREKKNIIDTNLSHQNRRYLCQIISFDGESSYYVFFFLPLKFVKKIDSSSGCVSVLEMIF
jgi:hypothetical protein